LCVRFDDFEDSRPYERDAPMKKKKALGLLALTGTLLVQALASAGPSTATEPVVTKTFMKGEGLLADFDRTDGCIQTKVTVFSNVSKIRGATALDQIAFVGISQFDLCTLTTLVDGFGQTDSPDQIITKDLSSGKLRMSMTFNNFVNGTTAPVTVNVSFRATAKVVTTFKRDAFESDGVRFVSAARTASRTATATGTVTLGSQNVVAPDISSINGSIDSAVNKTKTIDRPVK
jgi:hypothetical protein